MIGLILAGIVLLLVLITSVITYPLSLIIGLFDKNKKNRFCLGYIKCCMHALMFSVGVNVVYKGKENLPKKGEAVVYIGNHRGYFDIIATYAVVPDLTGFVAKKEMEHWPLIGWWMRSVYCLFLDRKNPKNALKTILDGIKQIKNGISVVIYPEGTRSKEEGVLLPFHAGSFKLATKSGAKIIPVASNNSGAVWDDHKPFAKQVTMCIDFLEPIETKDLSKEEQEALPERVHALLAKRVIENGLEIGSLKNIESAKYRI